MVKFAQIAALATTCLVAFTSAAQLNVESNGFEIFTDERFVKYYMSCIRGFNDGFAQGLFNNKDERVPKECLGESTYRNYIDLNRFLTSGNFIEVFKSIGKFYQIGFDI